MIFHSLQDKIKFIILINFHLYTIDKNIGQLFYIFLTSGFTISAKQIKPFSLDTDHI